MAALTPRVVRTARGPVEVAEAGPGPAGPAGLARRAGGGAPDAPAVLVVHGMPGDWRQARGLADDLAGDARVLLVSRPGYGRTPLSSGRSPEEQALLYRSLLDALAVPAAVVVGISGGGPSSYAFAAGHPQRCAGLVLCCAVRGGDLEVPVGMRRLAAVPGVWVALAAAARGVDAVRRATGRAPAPDPAACTPVERERLAQPEVLSALQVFEAERPRTLKGRGLRNDTRHLGVPPRPWPAGARVPVAVLHGDADEVVPVAHGEAYAAAIPGARLAVLPGLGHVVPVFGRDELVAEVRALLPW